ncbi:MAG: hypothetical protein ACP5KI_06465, partial [Brevinematia bacterium]
VIIHLPEKVFINANKITITTFDYSPKIQSIELPKLIGYISEGIFLKSYKKTTKSQEYEESPLEYGLKENEENVPQEESSPVGIFWEINKELKLKNETEIDILDIKVMVNKKYYVIPSKIPNGIMVLSISNVSDLSILPGEIELNIGKQLIGNLSINKVIPKNGEYQTDGIAINEIIVKRDIEERIENPKFLGTNKRIIRTYKNIIQNNLNNIEITILERVPIPYDDRIKIGIEKILPAPNTKSEEILKSGTLQISTYLEKGKVLENIVSYWVEYPANLIYYESER